MKRIVSRVALLIVVSGLTMGCGSERVPVYPVSGRLTINGKVPSEGWIVALHLEPAPDPNATYPHPLPRADVGPDGRFQFFTYETADGAPAGTFKVSFMRLEGGARQVYWPNPIE